MVNKMSNDEIKIEIKHYESIEDILKDYNYNHIKNLQDMCSEFGPNEVESGLSYILNFNFRLKHNIRGREMPLKMMDHFHEVARRVIESHVPGVTFTTRRAPRQDVEANNTGAE
jgi:hypothetical protein